MRRGTSEKEMEPLPTLSLLDLPTEKVPEKLGANEAIELSSPANSVDADEKGCEVPDFGGEGEEKHLYHDGEPVITTGKDVSYFAVDLRDDGDQALTFRSIFLGTMFAGMGAALVQVWVVILFLEKIIMVLV